MENQPVILLLDDEPIIIEVHELFFKQAGYQCLCATNNQQAFDLLRGHSVDLVIQDFARPGGSGDEFYAKLKRDNKSRHIPVLLACRGWTTYDAEIQKRLAGDCYLTDIWSLSELLAVVQGMLGSARKAV